MSRRPGLLTGLRVAEVGQRTATAYCGKLLADLGADVLKVEPASGDPMRAADPAYFAYLNDGKGSLAIDPGRGQLGPTLERADVVVVDSVGHELVDGVGQRIVVAITEYGLTGPRSGASANDFTLQAESGVMALHETAQGTPVVAGVELAELMGGTFGAIGALAALLSVAEGDQTVDVSMLESLMALTIYPWYNEQVPGHLPYMTPRRPSPGIQPASDGWVCMGTVTLEHWRSLQALLGVPALDDPALDVWAERNRRNAEISAHVSAFTRRHTVLELMDVCARHHLACAPVAGPDDVQDQPPYAARDRYVRNDFGGFLQPRPPFRFTGCTADEWWPLGPPVLGSSVGFDERPPRPTARPSTGVGGPLAGIRITDLTNFWAGPVATCLLAHLGADVVKVESPGRPDSTRLGDMEAGVPQRWELPAVWSNANLGKRSLTADLHDARGRELVRRLIASSDVVLENYAPRVVEKFGLDYESVRSVKDDIVMVRMPAFGLAGPWRDMAGFAFSVDALSGLASLTGAPDEGPLLTGSVLDAVGGCHAALATLAALWSRRGGGGGLCIEAALCDAASQMTAKAVVEGGGRRRGNRSEGAAPQGVYLSADGRRVALSISDDEAWQGLLAVVGSDALETLRSATLAERMAAHDAIDDAIAAWSGTRTAVEVVEALRGAGLSAAPVTVGPELIDHPQLLARGRVFQLDHDVRGRTTFIGPPFVRTGEPSAPFERPAPLFGEDNLDILRELGYGELEIAELGAVGITGTVPTQFRAAG